MADPRVICLIFLSLSHVILCQQDVVQDAWRPECSPTEQVHQTTPSTKEMLSENKDSAAEETATGTGHSRGGVLTVKRETGPIDTFTSLGSLGSSPGQIVQRESFPIHFGQFIPFANLIRPFI